MHRRMNDVLGSSKPTLSKPVHHGLGSGLGSGLGLGNTTFVIYLEPILNSYYQAYQNVLTLNTMPPGPLVDLVTMINLPKLSPFQSASVYASPFYQGGNCTAVLLRYPDLAGSGLGACKVADAFLGADDIPDVFSFLVSNGYTIDTSLTKMMNQSRVMIGGVSERTMSGDRRLVAMVSYGGV